MTSACQLGLAGTYPSERPFQRRSVVQFLKKLGLSTFLLVKLLVDMKKNLKIGLVCYMDTKSLFSI